MPKNIKILVQKILEGEKNDLTSNKKRKVIRPISQPPEEKECKDSRITERSIGHEQKLSLHQRRRQDSEKEISVEPVREIDPGSETSPSKSLYTTPKTTNSIYETPPAFPVIASGHEEVDKSLQTEILETGTIKPFAVLGLNSCEIEQRGTIEEAAAASGSDDEAPETVTKQSAKEHIKRLDLEATNASKRQAAAEKTRRREKDTRLKQQAGSTRRKRKSDMLSHTDDQSPTSTEKTTIADEALTARRKKRHIPEYLPDEILEMEPPLEVSANFAASHADKRKSQHRNDIVYFQEKKGPKDIKRGSVKVRVLKEENDLLPPKAKSQSRHIRESWLKGRPGRRGEAMFERRSIKQSFLVK